MEYRFPVLSIMSVGLLLLGPQTGVGQQRIAERPASPIDEPNAGNHVAVQHQGRDQYRTVNGVRLHYREWGHAAAPPLIILHGLTGHAWEFDRVAAALADRFHVFVLNQRGHGASAWTDTYSPQLMADDVAAFIDVLDLGRVRVIGHSMGGVNSWWLAARHPERIERLVIIDVDPEVITREDLVDGWKAALDAYAQSRYADPEEAVAEYLVGSSSTHREALRAFVLDNIEHGTDGHWTWRFDARGLIRWMEHASADAAAHWSAIRKVACLTLVIRAGDSPFTTVASTERMKRALPQARLVEIAGAGHDIHIDRFEALLAEVRPFLSPR